MKTNNCGWQTTFDTVNEIMTHTFTGNRVKVISDFKFSTCALFRDGELVGNKFDLRGMPAVDYGEHLSRIAESAATLERISHE
jgi:hypothetical protein